MARSNTEIKMGKLTHRKLSNEELLKEYGTGTFVFVGGTGLIPEQVPESNEAQDQEHSETSENETAPSGKKSSGR